MAFAERLADRLERSPLGRPLERLGAFSPVATLRTYGPGPRALLAEAENAAERGLHVARGVFLVLMLSVAFVQIGRASTGLLSLLVVLALIAATLWWIVWRVLRRIQPPRWLRFVLVLFDAYVALRAPLWAQTSLYSTLGAERFLLRDEIAAFTAPMLAMVAVSGAFRLDPRLAAFSTVVAILGWSYTAVVLGASRNLGLGVGAVIGFTGALGAQVARVFRYTMLKAREEVILERYVPAALSRELERTGNLGGPGREVEITVVIVDIRDYTRRAERLTPGETVAFLNDYFSVVVSPLAEEGAVLDKYVGDGVFAFLEGEAHQRRAMRAARAILAAVDRFNARLRSGDPVAIGIALHSGPALVGTIGAEQKREYTAIADAVNVAARLEELNKVFRSSIVASEVVIQAVDIEQRAGFVGPEVTAIRGHEATLAVRYLPRV